MEKSEISRKAHEIYNRAIKPIVEPEHHGKFLTLDIETGGYELGENELEVSRRAMERFPNGTRFGMRIGYPTAGWFRRRMAVSRV
jgi:hypothetical protein